MPRYDYQCRACTARFTIERSIHDPEGQILCPQCQSEDAVRDYSGVAFGGKANKGCGGSCGGCCGSCH